LRDAQSEPRPLGGFSRGHVESALLLRRQAPKAKRQPLGHAAAAAARAGALRVPLTEAIVTAVDRAYAGYLQPQGRPSIDFATPAGEPALFEPGSVTWQVCKNPVTVAIGGIAAVLLELAEPRVRAGVWTHTRFRHEPLQRLQRTGLATMVTVFGARSTAQSMIAAVVARHRRVQGITPEGERYEASDPALLDWVQATAAFGFAEAWHAHVRPLALSERDRYHAEGGEAASLYGAPGAPADVAAWAELLHRTRPRLEASPVIDEFLDILQRAPLLPAALRPVQRLLVRAAVALLAQPLREQIGLHHVPRLGAWERATVDRLARVADGLRLPSSPPVLACRRLGLDERRVFGHGGRVEP
jgi:uncharacterized protein (DUF2236 family)